MNRLRIPILSFLIMLCTGLFLRPEMFIERASAASHESEEIRYIVRKGDSLYKISNRFYQDPNKWKIIFDANQNLIKSPGELTVGWSLLIPNLDGLTQPSQPTAQEASAPRATAAPSPAPPPDAVQLPAAPETEPASKRILVTRNLYPPFVSQSLQNQGMLTDIIRTAFENMGYQIDIHFRTLEEGLNATREGRVTGTFPHAAHSSHEPSFFSSQPLYRVLIRAFVRNANPMPFNHLDDLQGLVLCQPKGTTTAELQPLIDSNSVKLERPDSIEACFHALVKKQVDMVVVDEFGGRNALHHMGFGDQICALDKAVAIETMHLLFSKIAPQNRIVLYEFDQAVRGLEQDGTLKSITARHLRSYYKTLPTALQTCVAPSSPEEAGVVQNVVTPSTPPTPPAAATEREIAETKTPKPAKPAAVSSFAPVRPAMPERSVEELSRITPLAAPHRQAGEFLELAPPQRAPRQFELVSLAVSNKPKIDGYEEQNIWERAPAVTTLDAASQRQITLKSVHTADEIFFLVSFPDQAASETHQSWGWDDDAEAYQPLGDREDTFVFKWSMVGNQVNLAFQNAEPHRADVWHWKALRTNPVGYADDKMHLLLPEPHQQATEVESPIHGSLYLRQLADAGQSPYREHHVKTYQAEYLPRYFPHQPDGSRADVRAKGIWHNNTWTVEFGRKMHTGHSDDINFDPGEVYLFAVSCYEMAYGKLSPNLTQPLYHSGDVFDRLLLRVARSEEG